MMPEAGFKLNLGQVTGLKEKCFLLRLESWQV